MNSLRKVVLLTILAGLFALLIVSPVAAQTSSALDCTFRPKYPVVNLREGPGTRYARAGFLRAGDTFEVVGQQAGADGFVWWKGTNDVWVRSDLGTSDCPATCGNTVCEYGETVSSCAKDCQGRNSALPSLTTTSDSTKATGCTYASCDACYAAFKRWPKECTQKTCTLNQYGCPVCETAP